MKPIAITPATVVLDSFGISYTLHKFESDVGAGFGKEAASNLKLDESQVFKTIMFGDKNVSAVAISPVIRKISSKKLAAAIGARSIEPMDAALAQRMSGYVVGGISPFGHKKALTTVIDSSAYMYDLIYVSGGRRGLEICISPVDLVRILNALTAAIQAE